MTLEQQKAIAIAEATKAQAEGTGGLDSSFAPPTATNAFALGASDLPIAGPYLQKGEAYLGAMMQHLMDPNLETNEIYQQNLSKMQAAQAEHPYAYMGGQALGTTATLGTAAAAAPAVAASLGASPEMALGTRAVASGTSNAAISAADAAVRGGNQEDVTKSGIIGGVAGTAFPIIGQGVSHLLETGKNTLSALKAFGFGGKAAGAKEAGKAIGADIASGNGLTPEEIAKASEVGIPMTVADLGGGPATKAALKNAATRNRDLATQFNTNQLERSGQAQKDRLLATFQTIADVPADAAAEVQNLHAEGQVLNKAAYDKAYTNTPIDMPKAIIDAPSVRRAMGETIQDWKDWHATGFTPTPKPRLIKAPDGSFKATTQFWDMVQRRLNIPKEGDNRPAMTSLRKVILEQLDNANDAYKQARKGAANFLGAENAVEFGEKAAAPGADLSHIRAAYGSLNDRQKVAFATGYVSKRMAQMRTQAPGQLLKTLERGKENGMDILALGRDKATALHNAIKVERTLEATHFIATGQNAMSAMNVGGTLGSGGIGAMAGFGLAHELGMSPGTSMLVGVGGMATAQQLKEAGLTDISRGILNTLTSSDPAVINQVYLAANQSPSVAKALDQAFKFAMKVVSRSAATGVPNAATLPEQPGQSRNRTPPLTNSIFGTPSNAR
jgi:hypothetical protein